MDPSTGGYSSAPPTPAPTSIAGAIGKAGHDAEDFLRRQDWAGVINFCTKCFVDFDGVTHDDYDGLSSDIHNKAHTAEATAARIVAASTGAGWWVVAAIALLVGLVLTLFGFEAFYLSLFLIGFITASTIVFGILCGATEIAWLAILIGLVAGLLVGVLVIKLEKVGVALAGAGAGIITYAYLNAFALSKLYDLIASGPGLGSQYSDFLPIIVVVVLALAGLILALCFERHIIIAGTSLGGAYLIFFGAVRLIAGTEAAQYNLNPIVLMAGGGCTSWKCWLLFAAIVVLAVMGMAFQEWRTRDDKHHEGEDNPVRRFSKPKRVPSGYAPAHDIEADLLRGNKRLLQGANAKELII